MGTESYGAQDARDRPLEDAIALVRAERERQDAKWGEQTHAYPVYRVILGEEIGEMDRAYLTQRFRVGWEDSAAERGWRCLDTRMEMVQACAVLLAMIERSLKEES